VLLTAIVGLGALSIDMFLPSLPAMMAVFGSDAATAQLTVTLFLAGLAASQLGWGPSRTASAAAGCCSPASPSTRRRGRHVRSRPP
jgi:hypothetical protein